MTTSKAHEGVDAPGLGIDPVTFEVLKNTFLNITEEMAYAVRRAAYSTNIKTRADFSCAFFDRQLRCIAQSFSEPPHLGSLRSVVPTAVAEFGPENFKNGDMIIVNDPHRGNSHLNDVALIAAVHVDGRPFGYVANIAHHVDVGGERPGQPRPQPGDLSGRNHLAGIAPGSPGQAGRRSHEADSEQRQGAEGNRRRFSGSDRR